MSHSNDTEQVEDLRNHPIPFHINDKSEQDILRELEINRTNTGQHAFRTYVPVPITTKAQIGSPVGKPVLCARCFSRTCTKLHITPQTALAIGAFATTLTTLSMALMEWRGLTITNVFIGNFFFVAGEFPMAKELCLSTTHTTNINCRHWNGSFC